MTSNANAPLKPKSPAYLFRSAALGALIVVVGIILFDPTSDSPDWAAAAVVGLISLPSSIAILTVIFVVILFAGFRPILHRINTYRGVSIFNAWLAIFVVSVPVVFVVGEIEGSTTEHVFLVLVALTAACLLFERKNRYV